MNLKLFIVSFCIPALTLASSAGGCLLYDPALKGKCYLCYQSEASKEGTCVQKSVDENCILKNFFGTCITCEEGYAVFHSGFLEPKLNNGKCVKAETPTNCVDAQISEKKVTCRACKNDFYPNFDESSCDSESSLENCIWATRDYQGNQPSCLRCKEGYLVKQGKCVEEKELVGCLGTSDGTSCNACDVWSGYFMKSAGKCSK